MSTEGYNKNEETIIRSPYRNGQPSVETEKRKNHTALPDEGTPHVYKDTKTEGTARTCGSRDSPLHWATGIQSQMRPVTTRSLTVPYLPEQEKANTNSPQDLAMGTTAFEK